jgi:histone acetyltransferase 1
MTEAEQCKARLSKMCCICLTHIVGSTSANTALKVRVVHPSGDKTKHKVFPPDFTYPIFGEEETIFGYEGLRITLDFQADNLRPNLHIQSKAKVEAVGDTKADEPEEILREFLPGMTQHS